MTTLTRLYRFSASHRLHSHALSDAQNSQLYGKCNNPFGHGHDYILEVTVAGPVRAEDGQIVSVGRLDTLVKNEILRVVAHRNLNLDVPHFRAVVPTTENLALFIADLLRDRWSDYLGDSSARLARVHVQETDRNGFEVVISDRSRKKFVPAREESQIVHV